MVYAQPKIRAGEWDSKTSPGFWDTNGSPLLIQATTPWDSQRKKWTCRIADFAVPAGGRVKLKESVKREKYLDLARELKKLWNMRVTVVPILISAFDTVT